MGTNSLKAKSAQERQVENTWLEAEESEWSSGDLHQIVSVLTVKKQGHVQLKHGRQSLFESNEMMQRVMTALDTIDFIHLIQFGDPVEVIEWLGKSSTW